MKDVQAGPGPSGSVPGARAPDLSVPGLLNSLPRLLLKAGGTFSAFLRSSLAGGAASAPTCFTWPSPIPYPEVFHRQCGRRGWKLKYISLAVACLSWLYLGKPACCPAEIRVGTPLNKHQRLCVLRLEAAAFGVHFPFEFSAADLGRHAAKVESQTDVLSALGRAAECLGREWGYLGSGEGFRFDTAASQRSCDEAAPSSAAYVKSPSLPGPGPTVARPIVADRIKLPRAPLFRPQQFMDARTAHRYNKPLDYARDPAGCPAPPRVKVLATVPEKLKLYRNLADTKRLVPLQEPPERRGFGAGLFAVGKDAARDRLILDARPANGLEDGGSRWSKTLASAVAVTGLVLPRDRTYLFSGADLKDCFYQFIATPDRVVRNMLADRLSVEQAEFVFRRPMHTHADDKGFVHIAFASLAMGDCGACEYAQCSHLGVCVQGGVVRPGELLVHAASPPRGLLSIGLVIDDLVCLDQVLSSQVAQVCAGDVPGAGSSRLDAALQAYRKAPLEVSDSKVFRNKVQASFWGITVCGASGWLKPNPHRLWPLILVTLRTVELGLATRHLLESITGCWISVFVLKRRLLAAMDLVFKAAAGEHNSVIRLSPELRAELSSLALLGPLCAVNLRAPVMPEITATDASSTWQAAVRATVPRPVAHEAFRQSVQRGAWTRLLSQPGAWLREHDMLSEANELPGGDVYQALPLYCGLATVPAYRELWRRKYSSRVHINIGELEAFLIEEARSGARSPCSRHVFALDSQVGIGCVAKGRSASPRLNELLARSIAPVLGFQIQTAAIYYPSSLNPADDGTRHKQIRPPAAEAPSWWAPLTRGSCSALERATIEAGFGPDGDEFDQNQLLELGGRHASRTQRRHRDAVFAGEGEQPNACISAAACFDAVWASVKSEASHDDLVAFPRQLYAFKASGLDLSLPGALLLFGGRNGLARQLLGWGCPWVLCLEPGFCAEHNPDDSVCRARLMRLLSAGAFLAVCAAPVASSMSRASCRMPRSTSHPLGFPHLSPESWYKVRRDNARAAWVAEVTEVCAAKSVAYAVDCPDTSFWWRTPGWAQASSPASGKVWRVDLCRFGAPWRKRSRVATNTSLSGARLLCDKSGHRCLHGFSSAHQRPWTAVARHRPRDYESALALALAAYAGWTAARPLDPAACAKLPNCCRVGEAANPGPRRPANRAQGGDLESQPLYSRTSEFLGLRAWASFLAWCSSSLSFDPTPVFTCCPALLAMALRSYGNWLFATGGSLQTFRYAILAGQRLSWSARGQLGAAWELVSRWERQQPVRHRTPVPEVILKAMVVVGWFKGFRRWAAVTVAAFYGIARIGEVLRASRLDLLLPKDHFSDVQAVFLRLEGPKSSTRGGAKVQHLRIDEPSAVAFLGKVFGNFAATERLYPLSPAAYRSRWNHILEALGLSRKLDLTPGGLRGGGAVWAYHSGLSISEIQWRMRLKHQHTLAFYLQEVAALNSILEAGPDARHTVFSAATFFSFLVSSTL